MTSPATVFQSVTESALAWAAATMQAAAMHALRNALAFFMFLSFLAGLLTGG
jgi:hypothetical protein